MKKLSTTELDMMVYNLQKTYPGHLFYMGVVYSRDDIVVKMDGHIIYTASSIELESICHPFLLLDECIKRINKYLSEPRLIIGGAEWR